MPSVSALSRFSASSNDIRVRVLGSKNRLTTVRPRSVGTFLIGRAPTSFMAIAVSRTRSISSRRQIVDAEQVAAVQRCGGASSLHLHFVPAVGLDQPDLHALLRARSACCVPT